MEEENEPLEALTAFTVVMYPSGGVDVLTSDVPEVNMERKAELVDIENAVNQISREVNRLLMKQLLMPKAPKTTSDLVSDALAKRSGES